MHRSWSSLSALLAAGVLAGCTGTAQPAPPPAPAAAPAHYSGLNGECPTLRSPESTRYTGSRTGKLIPLPRQADYMEYINCAWRPESGATPWVVVTVRINRDGFPAGVTGADRTDSYLVDIRDQALNRASTVPGGGVRAEERTTPSGRAVLQAEGDDSHLWQTTAVGNVVIVVKLIEDEPKSAAPDEHATWLLDELAATTEAITAEIVAQLEPGPDPVGSPGVSSPA
jgi:hypothetical protein